MPPPDAVGVYLPDGLDLSACLCPKWRDYGAWVVSGLYLRRHTEIYHGPDDYLPVSSAVLRAILPRRHYRAILDALAAGGVIEGRDGYWAGSGARRGRCKAYRLTDAYRDAPFRRERLTHTELVRKVRKFRERPDERSAAPVHRHLRQWVHRLTVIPGAPADSLPLAVIRDRRFFSKVCEQGRVHSNLTNLPRGLRKHLRAGGRPLWGIDVVNSQPLLLGLTLAGGRAALAAHLTIYRDWLTNPTHTPPPSHPHPHHPPPTTNTLPYVGTYSSAGQDDLRLYVDLCTEGQIYERLMKRTGFDRDLAKERFFAVAYNKPWQAARTVMGRAFREEFPSVWRSIRELNGSDHGELARRMQTVESYLVVWRACGRLMRAFPKAPLLTLHDCLLTDESHVEPF